MLFVKQDKKRLFNELRTIRRENKPLMDLLLDLRDYCKTEFNKDVVISHIARTPAEQDYLYHDNEKYQKSPWMSPHQFNQAIDISVKKYTEEEIEKILEYLKKYDEFNYYKWTAICHDVGHGKHFHIQFWKK